MSWSWRARTGRLGGLVAAALGAGYVTGLVAVWFASSNDGQPALGGLAAELVLAGGVVAGAGGLAVARWTKAHLGGARRLADEIDLIATVNPSHQVSGRGGPELAVLAGAVNRLASRFWESLSERDAAVAAGRREVEQERERLAALMAELAVGVLVCRVDGRILLYNHEARRLLDQAPEGPTRGAGWPSPVGLGRSVFSVLDRAALANAMSRLLGRPAGPGAPPVVRFAAAGAGGQLLRVSVGPVRGGGPGLSGFVLVVEDATQELESRDRRADLVRELLEEARGRLAAISGAVAMLESFDDLEPAEIARFRSIIADEAERLSGYLTGVQQRDNDVTAGGWELVDILCRDLLLAARRHIESAGEIEVAIGDDGGLWARADAGCVVGSLAAAAAELAESGEVKEVTVSCRPAAPFVALELSWGSEKPGGRSQAAARARSQANDGEVSALAHRHGGEAWFQEDVRDVLTVLLPAAAVPAPTASTVPAAVVEDRPIVYDFDLIAGRVVDDELAIRPLGELSYTVLDLETTGLEPSRGDRIVSVGAVRIVGGRVLRHESFESLVNPERPIPAPSTAIHGITDEMVADAPTVAEVLGGLASFAAETVLVGHNVAFDLAFLKQARAPTGVRIEAPVLDTLLLAELAFGEAETHTLEWLGATLGVDVTGRHTALGDALMTAEVLLRLVPLLDAKGLRTLGQVTAAAATTRYARLDYAR